MATTKIYRGRLAWSSNGEEDDLLGLSTCEGLRPHAVIVAQQIRNDMQAHGRYLTVRYYLAVQPLGEEEIRQEWTRTVMGLGNADYSMAYSDITGYLWTDESLRVGGHNLLAELKSHVDKFCQLEIEYCKEDELPGREEGHA